MIIESTYRYPGSRPFEDTDHDRRLFFGREKEKQALLYRVLAKRLVVVYGKSGMGKTSLLNAGLNLLLRDNHCIPLNIRFIDEKMDPVQSVFSWIKKRARQSNLDYEPGEEQTLWQYFKTAAFWSGSDTLLTPVLILDQFEEFFNFHSVESRKRFITQLADLVSGNIPSQLRESMIPGKSFRYDSRPPEVKVLISMREDSIGLLDEMSGDIQEILHNRFRLTAMDRDQARDAITRPAQLMDQRITTPCFQYSEDAVDMMMDFLCTRKEKQGNVSTDEVESFQLQLLCQHIENNVRQRSASTREKIVIKREDLGGQDGMQEVLQHFYDRHIRDLESASIRKRVRKLCERGLISVSDRRLSLEEEDIERRFKVNSAVLADLVQCRLIRADQRVGSVYYELSHDTLVNPIRESQRFHRHKLVKRAAVFIGLPLLLFSLIFLFMQGNRKDIDLLFNEARKSAFSRYYEEARLKYEHIIRRDKKNVTAYMELARTYSDCGEFHKAEATCARAINLGLESPEIYIELGNIALAKGNDKKAIQHYENAVTFDPDKPGPFERLGDAYYKFKKFDKAILHYEKALEIMPRNPDTYRKLALSYIESGKVDEALQVYQRAIGLDPQYAGIYSKLTGALYEKDAEPSRIKLLEAAAALDSKDGSYYYDLGKEFKRAGHHKKALSLFAKTIKMNPDNLSAKKDSASLQVEIGTALIREGKYSRAIRVLKETLKVLTGDSRPHYRLGTAYYGSRNFKDAISHFKESLRFDPQSVQPRIGLAKACLVNGHFTDAVTYADCVLKADTKNISPLYLQEMRFVAIAALLAQKKPLPRENYLRPFIDSSTQNRDTHRKNLFYPNLNYFVMQNKTLKVHEKKLLSRLITILESPNPRYLSKYKEWENDYLHNNNYIAKIAELEQAIKLHPQKPGPYIRLAEFLIRENRFREAVSLYRRAIKVDNNLAGIYKTIAATLKEHGGESYLLNLYEAASTAEIRQESYFMTLGYLFKAHKKFARADACFKKVLSINPKAVSELIGKGKSMAAQAKYDAAVEFYRKALVLNPSSYDAYIGFGHALLKQRKYDEAIDGFQKATGIEPRSPQSYNHLGTALYYKRNFKEAGIQFKKALSIDPTFVPAAANLAKTFMVTGQFDMASRLVDWVLNKQKSPVSMRHKLEMEFIAIVVLFRQNNISKGWDALKELIRFFRSKEDEIGSKWDYGLLKQVIREDKMLKTRERKALIAVLKNFESAGSK